MTLFSATSLPWSDPWEPEKHFVTDGPYFYRTGTGTLLMLWSTHLGGRYAQCLARSESGHVRGPYTHLPPLFREDGGHGMLFRSREGLMLTLHQPNTLDHEHPVFLPIEDQGDTLKLL